MVSNPREWEEIPLLSLSLSLPRARKEINEGSFHRFFPSTSDLGRRKQRVVFSSWGDFPDHRHRGQNLLPVGRSIIQAGPSLILCYCHAVNLSPIFFVTLPGGKRIRRSEGKGRGREAKLPPGTSPGAVPGASYHLQALSLYTSTRGKGWPPSAARNIWLASAFGHLAPPLSALDVTRHLVR